AGGRLFSLAPRAHARGFFSGDCLVGRVSAARAPVVAAVGADPRVTRQSELNVGLRADDTSDPKTTARSALTRPTSKPFSPRLRALLLPADAALLEAERHECR